jgi:glutathione peroxidase
MNPVKQFYKHLACFLIFVSLFASVNAQTIYSQSLKNIDGNEININALSDKRIMLIVMPLNAGDSLIEQIISFAQANKEVLHVIGVLSNEDGYSVSRKQDVKDLYKDSGIILTEGLNTKKGAQQSGLMQWLTDRKKNLHFDMNCKGIGHKYFVSPKGTLYSVIGPELSLHTPAIQRILSASVN